MSRCYKCDYTRTGESIYHDGLSLSHSANNRLVWDEQKLAYICSDCMTKTWGFPSELAEVPIIKVEDEDSASS